MPVDPETGLIVQDPPSMFAPGMAAGPTAAYNSTRAMSLANEHEQRMQLENMLLGLTQKRQEQELQQQQLRNDLFQKYAAEMSHVGDQTPQTGAPGPGFELGSGPGSTPPTEMGAPSPEEVQARAQLAAAKYAQPGAYQWGNLINRGYANDIRQQLANVAQGNLQWRSKLADARIDEIQKMTPIRVKNAQIYATLTAARTGLMGVHQKLANLELAQEQSGTSPRQLAVAAGIQRDIATIDAKIYAAKAAAANKALLPDERTDALADVAESERVLELEKRSLQDVMDKLPKASSGPPVLSSQFGNTTASGAGSPFPGGTPAPAPAPSTTTTKALSYDPSTGQLVGQ